MKTKRKYYAAILFSLSLIIPACNNTGYEIEEIDNTSDGLTTEKLVGQQPENTRDGLSQTNTQTEQTINTTKPAEEKEQINGYIIQLGAFSTEHFAAELADKVKAASGYDAAYTKIAGLYKVRVTITGTQTDADKSLETLKALGYFDSFISKTSK